MAQIDGEVGQQCLDLPPLLVPESHALHGEAVAQGTQTRPTPTVGGPQAHGVTQREKPASQETIRERSTLLGDEEDVRQGRIAEGGSQGGRAAERYDGGGMQRDQP